jgi:hypothetical protein
MLGIGPIRWSLALSRPTLEGFRLEVYASMGAWLAPSEYRVFLFSERGPTLVSTRGVHMWHRIIRCEASVQPDGEICSLDGIGLCGALVG